MHWSWMMVCLLRCRVSAKSRANATCSTQTNNRKQRIFILPNGSVKKQLSKRYSLLDYQQIQNIAKVRIASFLDSTWYVKGNEPLHLDDRAARQLVNAIAGCSS